MALLDPSTMQSYEYDPLQPGEIRLLQLDAIRNPQQPLPGSIIHHQLEHCLPYDAISYHWGSDTRTPFKIIVHGGNGQEFFITISSTLHTILRRLALPKIN